MKNKGIALLISLVVIGIVAAIAFAVASLIIGGFPIAKTAANSQKAFFAADTGVECVLYWDLQEKAFEPAYSTDIYCNNSDPITVGGAPFPASFSFSFDLENDSCTNVTVEKNFIISTTTVITSSGYNPCNPSPNRVERTLEIKY